MNEMSKDLHDAVDTIASFCEFQVCHSCRFMHAQGCILMHEIPSDWMDYIGQDGDDDD